MARHKKSKRQLLQLITQYGIHIWAILIIANAVMVYAYQFATHAAGKTSPPLRNLTISQTPSPSVSPNQPSSSPSSGPLGPTINLIFTVPGIGSGGGVMKPLHTERNVTVYLYAPDVNSLDPSVKPLYTIQTNAFFDSDPTSPTYTSFLNPQIDLGNDVKDGNYQIGFRTDLSLRTIIKQNPTDLGGEIFGLSKLAPAIPIPPQTVLMGDVVPAKGDNKIDINDYNAFITCYGERNTTNSLCKTGNFGDFDDNGIIDGIDYNIFLRSLFVLSQEGFTTLQLTPTPSTKVIHKITPKITPKKKPPTPSPVVAQSPGGATNGGVLFLFFIIILGVIGIVLYFKNETIHTLINSLIHLSPTGTPSGETDNQTPAQNRQQNETETPTEEQPAQPSSSRKTGDVLEKDCYIKIKEKDEAGTGMWLLLTDDNGALNAHYAKTDAKDGFAKVKGVMKEENGKKFLEISELTMEG